MAVGSEERAPTRVAAMAPAALPSSIAAATDLPAARANAAAPTKASPAAVASSACTTRGGTWTARPDSQRTDPDFPRVTATARADRPSHAAASSAVWESSTSWPLSAAASAS